MNLDLAEDVSWRSLRGPLATIRLAAYGRDARRTAKALGMVIDGDMAHITEHTPSLAEKMLEGKNS